MIHDLKIGPEYLHNLNTGLKKSEIRLNDRDYQRGDVLRFTGLTKCVCMFEITHIHSGRGMAENYVALSLKSVD